MWQELTGGGWGVFWESVQLVGVGSEAGAASCHCCRLPFVKVSSDLLRGSVVGYLAMCKFVTKLKGSCFYLLAFAGFFKNQKNHYSI